MPKRVPVAKLFTVDETPLVLDPVSPRVWGLPIDPAWWCEYARGPGNLESIVRLSALSGKTAANRRAYFAPEVARAFTEVQAWARAGVPV